jgi:glycerophosphoryl diester phosphodiesterase
MLFDLQGHRGARGLSPESSIPGFLKALEIGVTTLEMDVVVSADSEVVVSHEPWMSDEICSLPNGNPVPEGSREQFNLYAMSYDEISQFDCGSRPHPRFPRQVLQPTVKPRLSEVIAAAESWTRQSGVQPVWYNIETKSSPATDRVFHPEPGDFVEILLDVVRRAGVADRVILQSFDVRTLQYARTIGAEVELSLLIEGGNDQDFASNIQQLGFDPDIYSPHYGLVDVELMENARERGIKVIPWTVNELDEMIRLKNMGVDGLITDYPDLGIKLLD